LKFNADKQPKAGEFHRLFVLIGLPQKTDLEHADIASDKGADEGHSAQWLAHLKLANIDLLTYGGLT
jgi:hypothetical protein